MQNRRTLFYRHNSIILSNCNIFWNKSTLRDGDKSRGYNYNSFGVALT